MYFEGGNTGLRTLVFGGSKGIGIWGKYNECTVQYSTVQYNTVQYSTVQYSAGIYARTRPDEG